MQFGLTRQAGALAIGFADHNGVGEFQDAFLDALKLITPTGSNSIKKKSTILET